MTSHFLQPIELTVLGEYDYTRFLSRLYHLKPASKAELMLAPC